MPYLAEFLMTMHLRASDDAYRRSHLASFLSSDSQMMAIELPLDQTRLRGLLQDPSKEQECDYTDS